ncbi:MAG: N-6 DNA methylase [Desulfobacterales bacterium]|nr:N-6 DNA methylase [Desulfobacterales bacterium]
MNLFYTIRDELKQIGYVDNLLQEDYVFDDAAASGTQDLTIPLAAFAQWPPSYRNACIGVLSANGQSGPRHISMYQTLGAPMFLEAFPDHVDRYRIEATGKPVFLESIPARDIRQIFKLNKKKWSPETIFRAKAIAQVAEPVQLDFVDIGLLPALKGMIHAKLDRLLKDILREAVISYESILSSKPDETSLFRLVFRFLAAKIFNDRKHPGNWSTSKSSVIIDSVQKFYGPFEAGTQSVLDEPKTQKIVWDRLRGAFNFQNLSVEDLAFIYENTLIRKETREQFGIHSTPSIIAELMVDRLPFELLPQEGRYVLEPCAGHGVFLVAALRRLRELLPVSWTDHQRHSYLKERLTALELDTFASEVCRLSLMLADYPNQDGWQIISEDIFGGNVLERLLKTSRVVLCNPPFEDFSMAERNRYGDNVQNVHKPYEVLRRVLEHPPDMLGFVLPKSAIMGERYSDLQDRIARNYKNIETIALPDRIFAYSDQETMIVLASERDESTRSAISTKTFWVRENDRRSFLETAQLPEAIGKKVNRASHTVPISLWHPPLFEIWEYLKANPRLKDIAEIHRGIEWNIPLTKSRDIFISSDPKPGFKKGLANVREKIEPYYALGFVYLNMDEQYKRTNAHLLPWDRPKVIVNTFIVSRSPWRIVAYPDSDGLVCRENFIGIWPNRDINIEVVSALINSPLVNAALYTREGKRLNRIVTLKQIPVPFSDTIDTEKISFLVKQYAKLRFEFERHPLEKKEINQCIKTIMEIDGLILKAYDFPPRLERKLLELFRGHSRPVPFHFPDYFPEDFSPCIPLHKYLEMDLKQASAGELLKRITPFDSEDMHEFFMDIEAGQS